MRLTLKLIALLAVMAAVVLPRGTAHDRVMLLVFEGARAEVVRALARAGHLPTLEKVVAGGVGGEITSASEASSADHVLTTIVSVPSADGVWGAEPQQPLWELLSRQVRPYVVSGAPGCQFAEAAGAVVLPGPDPATGFIGTNTGLVVNRRTIERGPLVWPYDVGSEVLREAVAALSGPGTVRWLRWQDPSGVESRVGTYAVYTLDEDTVYLTPVYTRFVDGTDIEGAPARIDYVGDDPTRVRLSSRAQEYLPRHEGDLADARAGLSLALAAAKPWELLVHVDRRIAITEAAFAPTGAKDAARDRAGIASEEYPPAAVLDAYKAVDAMLAKWLEVAGPRTAVVVVGLTPEPRARGEAIGWFAVASVVGDLGSWGPVSADDLAVTLSYLLSFDVGAGRAPLGAIASRFPLRSRFGFHSGSDVGVSVRADGRALLDIVGAIPHARQ